MSLGMTDFDRTLTFFHMQDEHDRSLVKCLRSNPNAKTSWNKVVAAFQAAFVPAFA
jgi:hypothetical protein